ncbi:transporter, SSS family [Dictyocaulus viviparus]|uniref:Transporter, SSS family n=1 Tax=Dictyocaulus viviparus TaxID=29172 RepID=A0A0D8YA05_DICVI|nr:transporter, SSS family [Dictyocaulus viviparus]
MASDRTLSWFDYAIFSASLMLSIGTGIYHAIRSHLLIKSGRTKSTAKDEYLMGGHQMPPIPVALSLLTTFLSGILMLGVPAEIFQRGPQIWMNFIVGTVSSVITCLVFLPVFHKMKCTCLHEYFIHRYNSTLIRQLFSTLFLCFTITYMSIVIYAPAVALSPVLHIHKWWLVLIFGLITTLYTCIGGLKAVVWSDSLQAFLMYSGVFTLIIQGIRHPKVGGLSRIWDVAKESGRIAEVFRFDLRIDQYNSVWINLISGTITWLASFGVNQLAIQRYASLPTLEQAQRIIYYTLLPFFILCSVVAFVGFITLAYFYNCNPIETGEILETDHLTILFARDILQPTPGLFGLYVSCIMSATLSTLSSGMNSVAAAIYEDFLKQKFDGKITDKQATFINKATVVSCGMISTLLAFSAESLGGILRVKFYEISWGDFNEKVHQVCVSVLGAMSGPMVAIFVLAMFFPRSGFWSCIVSFVISNIIMMIICIANYVEDPYRDLFLPTNTRQIISITAANVDGCDSLNFTIREQPQYDPHYGDPNTMFISRISTYSYAGVGFVIMILIGVFINLFKTEQQPEKIRHLTFTGRNEPWPELQHEYDHFICEEKTM